MIHTDRLTRLFLALVSIDNPSRQEAAVSTYIKTQLDELGIPINRFHEYKELPALVQQAMNGKLQRSTDEQRALLPAHYSWDAVHKDWLGLYE